MDIVADILHVAVSGVRKTHIMYACNLSFRQLETYLNFLLDRRLLKVVSEEEKTNREFFEITNKGQVLLNAYHNLKALISS